MNLSDEDRRIIVELELEKAKIEPTRQLIEKIKHYIEVYK